MVAHVTWTHGVAGSSPASQTTSKEEYHLRTLLTQVGSALVI